MTLREKRKRSEYDRHLDGWTREELVAYIHELEGEHLGEDQWDKVDEIEIELEEAMEALRELKNMTKQ